MMLLSEAAKAINAELIGVDAKLTSVNTDSRQVESGQLFVALKGDHFDGHDYAQQAIQQGAAAVLVSHAIAGAEPALVVTDTYQALGELAAYWRCKFSLPLAAITGSNGKTTVKEMLANILRAATGDADTVLATQGNLNNHIGLPLTLLKLTAQHRYAVIEMGMNHTGEISYLTNIAKPTVALINNAGNAHLGELGSFEAIAKAKAEIFEGLSDDGVAVINADDVFAPLWTGLNAQRKIISFGLKNSADVTATYHLEATASQLEITTSLGALSVRLPAPGVHNVMNALAATAAAIGMGATLNSIVLGLESYAGVKGRLQHQAGLHGALVIDDSYNANPMSMKAAIDVLVARAGNKLLVLGDMGELGEDAAEMHSELGRYAKAAGVDALFTLGELSVEISKAFGAGAQHYSEPQALSADLLARMTPDSTVLVKGSRFMAMERIVHEIVSEATVQKERNNLKGTH
ncbi:UDP-N-acetylmuramoyl-tripeptide--D-alanyl-D-alanine ligase [mine drainage metagenome]|uniref:UDP-MurNAc-pentapeptide synthetase n=1 Tax=mine drainage metagenome TaxID=410659 RepID=A0A1J5SE44_9ZZZZ